MEELNRRRLGKARKNNNRPKRDVKSRRQKRKSDDRLFAALDRHRKSNKLIHKITTERLTIRPGLFENAIRSDVIRKEKDQAVYMPDDVRAVLDEDLFQYLDSTNRNNNSTKRLKRNARQIQPDSVTVAAINSDDTTQQESEDYGSLFRSIQEQYTNRCGGSGDFDKNLDRLPKLVSDVLQAPGFSPQGQSYQNLVDKLCQILPEKYLVYRILHAQQNFGRATDSSAPLEKRRMAEEATRHAMDVERCRTPDNQAVAFPEDSYHTPENQKYNLQEPPPSSSSSKFEPGIYVVPQDYRSTIRDDCLLQNQVDVKLGDGSGTRPMLYHVNATGRFAFAPYHKDPSELGITRIVEKRQKCNLFSTESNALERSSKLFKFDFGRKSADENVAVDFRNEHHSFVHSRPKKMFAFENSFASPAEEHRAKVAEPRRKLEYETHSSQARDLLDLEPVPLARAQQRTKRSAAAVQGFVKPKYSPQDFAARPGRVPLRARFSPNELNLRKKYAPHTLTVDELDGPSPSADTKNYFMDQMPTCTETPGIQFKPRFHM